MPDLFNLLINNHEHKWLTKEQLLKAVNSSIDCLIAEYEPGDVLELGIWKPDSEEVPDAGTGAHPN